MFKHKIFNFLRTKKIEGIIFRGVFFLIYAIIKWFDYIETKKGMDFLGGFLFTAFALFKIDDYLEYKKEKTKIINEN